MSDLENVTVLAAGRWHHLGRHLPDLLSQGSRRREGPIETRLDMTLFCRQIAPALDIDDGWRKRNRTVRPPGNIIGRCPSCPPCQGMELVEIPRLEEGGHAIIRPGRPYTLSSDRASG